MSFLFAFNTGLEKVMAHCPVMQMIYQMTTTHHAHHKKHQELKSDIKGIILNRVVNVIMLTIYDLNELLEKFMAANPLAQMFYEVTKNGNVGDLFTSASELMMPTTPFSMIQGPGIQML